MKPHLSHLVDQSIDAELDRLTYSAYLLTLDPGLALSVVTAALNGSLEDLDSDLRGRIVDLSLQQLKREFGERWDTQSSPCDAVLYGISGASDSKPFPSLTEAINGNPILSLGSRARVAFVLHHLLGYTIKDAAGKAEMSEKEFRAQLRKAYVQLASFQFGPQVSGNVLGSPAMA